MIKVFIGGSRKIIKLNKYIKGRIDNVIQKEYTVLIGDANGVDKSVQKYLFEKNYKNVFVFCMNNECRNNIGNWETKHISKTSSRKDYYYYSIKDLEMVKETDYGLMIWDGKSKGTLNNIINLLKENKKVMVYFFPDKEFYKLIIFNDLEKLLTRCEKSIKEIFDGKFKISQILKKEQQQKFDFG